MTISKLGNRSEPDTHSPKGVRPSDFYLLDVAFRVQVMAGQVLPVAHQAQGELDLVQPFLELVHVLILIQLVVGEEA